MKFFKTPNMYLAAALKTKGYKLRDIQKDPRGHCDFFFEDNKENLEAIAETYFSGELEGSLRNFSYAWRDLKAYIEKL